MPDSGGGGGGTVPCAGVLCACAGSGGPDSPKIEKLPECVTRGAGAGAGWTAGESGRNSVPDTLILGSSRGALEQPNTVHPPFSAKHSG